MTPMPGSIPILVVEDDAANRRMLAALLKSEGWRPLPAADGAEGLRLAQTEAPWAALLDLGLPDRPGMEILSELKKRWPALPVIVLTGDTEVSSAVKALQAGAFNYFTKPIQTDQVLAALRACLEQARLARQVSDLRGQLSGQGGLARSMGPSLAVRGLEEEVRRVAASSFTVLVHGESGTGKEVVSRALHDLSPRAAQPFVALDCGAIPEALLESELFGYEKGAFSGAERRKEGHIVLAQGGTLFLDEIGNLPMALQAKLLRVLQEKELKPLGGTRTVALDVRIVAASNRNLEEEARAGRFRQDLYFRLAEFKLELPPLRERPEDIPYLAQRFLEEASVELRRPVQGLAAGALSLLKDYPWPGNVRELRNVIRQGVLLSQGAELEAAPLKPLLKAPSKRGAKAVQGASLKELGEAALAAAEREAIQAALRQSGGKILPAARALHVDNKTLHTKLKKYGLRARDYEAGEGA
jgi:DNA-binding NtrC family response regulator